MTIWGNLRDDFALGQPKASVVGRRRVVWIAVWTLAVMCGVELAVQVRTHVLFGQSVLTMLFGQPEYVFDKAAGLLLLRPNSTIQGGRQIIRSNRLGLRSDDLPDAKPEGERRVAVIGASSVMGAYSANNEETLPSYLQSRLRAQLPKISVHVINAGIVGYTLSEQGRMLEYVSDKLSPDLIFVYPGTNDFAAYCRSANSTNPDRPYRLPQAQLPRWLASVDLLLKNTVALRPAASVGKRLQDASSIDLLGYRRALEALVRSAQQRRVNIVLSTNARSYRPEQTPEVQDRLATTARYYNSCFDVAGLNTLYARHNEVIKEVGAQFGVPVLPVGELVPGGADFFEDSSHFNERGKRLVAKIFAEFVDEKDYLEKGGGH